MTHESTCQPIPHQRDRIVLFLAAAAGLLALLSYAALDGPASSWFLHNDTVWYSSSLVQAFTFLGKTWLQITLLFVWFFMAGRVRSLQLALVALLAVGLIVPSTKFVTHRTRPSEAQKILASGHADTSPNVWYDHASFPSGDTASACAVAASIGCSSALPWMPVFLTLAGGVGFLRVVACAHYPSDVFAGAAVGLFCVWLALQITRRWSLLEWAPLQTLRRIAVAGAIVITLWILLCEKARTSDLFLKAYVLPLAVLCVWTSVPPWLKRRKQRQCQSCRSATTGSTRAARSVG